MGLAVIAFKSRGQSPMEASTARAAGVSGKKRTTLPSRFLASSSLPAVSLEQGEHDVDSRFGPAFARQAGQILHCILPLVEHAKAFEDPGIRFTAGHELDQLPGQGERHFGAPELLRSYHLIQQSFIVDAREA